MSPLSLRSQQLLCPRARVHGCRLDDDAPVLDEFLNMRARVGVSDFSLLGGIKPDLALADASDGGGESFLGAQVDHFVLVFCWKTNVGCCQRRRGGYGT